MPPKPVNKLRYCVRMSNGIVEMVSTLCMRPRASILLHLSSGVRTLSATNISVEHRFDRHVSIASNLPRTFNVEPVALFRRASVLVRLYGVSCLNKFVSKTVTSVPVSSLNLISCLPSTAMTACQVFEFLANSSTSRKTFEASHMISLTILGCEGLVVDDLLTFRKYSVLLHAWQEMTFFLPSNLCVCEVTTAAPFADGVLGVLRRFSSFQFGSEFLAAFC